MTTEWVITTAAERVELREGKAETTFTVTNAGPAQDRVVFEVVAGDGADPSWFLPPQEPQLLVGPNGSATFLVKIVVPPTAAGGGYWLQGRAYSADTAPEEGSRLSGRVAFEVAPPVKPKKPWWPYALGAALVLVVLIVVGFVVFGGDDEPQTGPSPSPSPVRPIPTPIVAGRALDIPQTFTVDFDTGAIGGAGNDLFFVAQTATIRFLQTRTTAQMALLPAGSAANFTTCSAAAMSNATIPVERLQPGSVVCLRTSEGRLAVITVRQPVGPSPGRLLVSYDLFNPVANP